MSDLKEASVIIYISITQKPGVPQTHLRTGARKKVKARLRWGRVGLALRSTERLHFYLVYTLDFCVRFHLKKDPCATRNMKNIANNKKDVKSNGQIPKFYK